MSNAPTAKEIRLFCDGELSLPEAAAIEAKLREHPDAAALAGFERELKTRVAATLKDGSAPPAGLADRIRETLAAETEAPAPAPAATTPPQPISMHRAWWKAPLRANAFAVAASLVLVAGAVLFGIFGQPIDSWRRGPVLDIASEAAAAVANEHARAASGPNGLSRLGRYDTADIAGRELAPFLGDGGCVYDLTEIGYTFVGGDTCTVPGCEQGCHLLYARSTGQQGIITVHVVPRPSSEELLGTSGLDHLPVPTDKIPRSSNCLMDVLVWNHGDRSYLLSVCIPRDAEKIALEMQRQLLAGGP